MSGLKCHAELRLRDLPDYLHLIVDRLASFEAAVERMADGIAFVYPFGSAFLATGRHGLAMDLRADNADGLQRVRELVTVAIQVYAKHEAPRIVWHGDLAGGGELVTFRKMRVLHAQDVTPHMRRIRLAGDNLARYGRFGGMHVRMLFPTDDNPEPVWPVAGPDGLPAWPSEDRKPVARVYTIRQLDAEAGFMDVDFVIHGDEGIGSAWAMRAAPGDEVGIIGPLGRPVRQADWYVLGCDETGLPALSRILENLPAETRGTAFIEIAGAAEQQAIAHPEGVVLHWIHRRDDGASRALVDAVADVPWPSEGSAFGWFAAEAEPARRLRDYWRNTLSHGRDQTLVAGYWRRGAKGVMAS